MMEMAEGEQRHRHSRENERDSQRRYVITEDARIMKQGLGAAVVLIAGVLAGSAFFFVNGKMAAGFTFASAPVLSAAVTIVRIIKGAPKKEDKNAGKSPP